MVTDDAFNEEFKPLHIPSAYHADDSWKDKIVFALAELGYATAKQTADELHRRDAHIAIDEAEKHANAILTTLFDKGLIKGSLHNESMVYNLSKILTPNSGSTHPSHKEE